MQVRSLPKRDLFAATALRGICVGSLGTASATERVQEGVLRGMVETIDGVPMTTAMAAMVMLAFSGESHVPVVTTMPTPIV